MLQTKKASQLLSNHADFIQRMESRRFRLSRILKVLHKRRILKNVSRREVDAEKALEDERATFKTKWLEDIGSDWDDDKVYPSCSDSSLTDCSEDEPPPVKTAKKETNRAKAADARSSCVKAEPTGNHDMYPPAAANGDAARYPASSLLQAARPALGSSDGISKTEAIATEELNQVSHDEGVLAKTIVHLINDLYRRVGRRDAVLASVLRAAAEEDNCDVVKQWLDPKPSTAYIALEAPILIKDDDNTSSDGVSKRRLRNRSAPSHASDDSKCASATPGWPDHDLHKYHCPSNPKNWPPEQEFSSSVLLNQGLDCVSKAVAMEYRSRKPLEHVEIQIITDQSNPCYGARGLFAKAAIPKGRIVCPYMGLYREQTESNSHYIFNLNLDIPSSGKAAPKMVRLDVDSRGSCIGNESKFINDGICIECIQKLQADSEHESPQPKHSSRGGTRWLACKKCRPSNVQAVARLNSLLGIPYIAIVSLRAIKKNEELLLNYGEGYWTNMQPEEVNAEASKVLSRDDTSTARPSSNPPLPAAKKSKTAAPASASVLLHPARPGTSSSAATVPPASITMIVPEN